MLLYREEVREGDINRCCELKDVLGFVRVREDNSLELTVENKENSEMERIGTWGKDVVLGNIRLIQTVYA